MRLAIFAIVLMAAAGATRADAQSRRPEGAVLRPQADAADLRAPSDPQAPALRTALPLEDLAVLNGRQGDTVSVAITEQDLDAVNHGNTVSGATVGSGQISIGRGAYEGFAGVGNFVINSGHNNNLQGALTINIVTP